MSLFVPLVKTAQLPRRYHLTQGYSQYHQALDMVGTYAQKVIAAQSGIVFASSWEGDGWAFGGGNVVIIDHFGPGGRRSKTAYAHMLTRSVKKGQYVLRGQVLGTVDSTGNSNGNHLHFAFAEAIGNPDLYYSYHWYDPRLYMKAHAYMNGKQGHGSRSNSSFTLNTFIVNANVNMRASASLSANILRTTRVKENTVYLATVSGATWNGSKVWHKLWSPSAGVCYVHSLLGVLS